MKYKIAAAAVSAEFIIELIIFDMFALPLQKPDGENLSSIQTISNHLIFLVIQ